MATVDDNWYALIKRPDGTTQKVPTSRHGVGSRWLVRWRDDAGTPRKKSFARKADAERAAAEIETELARGTYLDPDAGMIRFRDYAEQWRRSQFSDPGTTYQVGIRFRLHVYPTFGHLPLRAITPSVIRQWTSGLRMARSYQRTIFANVSQVFGAAIADDLIAKNPCRSGTVRKPVPDPRPIIPWPAQWVAGVRDALPARYAVVATLAAGAGLRQGEILGLTPDDIDTRQGTVHVRRQVKLTAGNQPYLALPKGRKTRSVPVPPSVIDAVLGHLTDLPVRTLTLPWDRPDGDPLTVSLMLTSRESTPVNRHYFNAKIWKPALMVAGVPPTRDNGCHALRHYYASVLLDGGESIKTVSERLGHADPAFTLRTYTHLLPSSESRTKEIIEAALPALPRRPGSRPCATDVPRSSR
ncbi:tyrosine-type recombinase/integrase [Pseudonocardia saturnea]